TVELAEEIAGGNPVSLARPDYLGDHDRDVAEAKEREEIASALLAKFRDDLVATEVALADAERAVEGLAADLMRALVDGYLVEFKRHHAARERFELKAMGVLRLTASVLHRHQKKFLGVLDALRSGGVSYRDRTFHPSDDP